MNRVSCRLALLALAALATTVASGCSFVQPPALTISSGPTADPFLTVTSEEMWADLAKDEGGATGPTTTRPTSVPAETISQYLTSKARPAIMKQAMAKKGVVVTDQDKAVVEKAQQQQQQQQQQLSEEEIEYQAGYYALANALAKDFFAKPENNLESYARTFYEQRKESFAQPAQTCLHVVTVDAGDGQTRPTDEQLNAALPAAQALRQRLNTETFAEVSKSSGRSAANIPGGDMGCGAENNLPETLTTQIAAVPTGSTSSPLKWELGWVVVRVDDRKAARTPSFEEVRADAENATRQTFGQQFVTKLIEEINSSFMVEVDPRYGRWDTQRGQVLPPEGSATPTIPTTTTTTPSLLGEQGPEGSPAAGAPTPTSTRP